jgi:predicted DNA-binding protein YlxM (UPF0122 family)
MLASMRARPGNPAFHIVILLLSTDPRASLAPQPLLISLTEITDSIELSKGEIDDHYKNAVDSLPEAVYTSLLHNEDEAKRKFAETLQNSVEEQVNTGIAPQVTRRTARTSNLHLYSASRQLPLSFLSLVPHNQNASRQTKVSLKWKDGETNPGKGLQSVDVKIPGAFQ